MEESTATNDAQIPGQTVADDEDLVSDAESSVNTEDVWNAISLPNRPKIHMQFDIPMWFAAWSMIIVSYVITSTTEMCRCR